MYDGARERWSTTPVILYLSGNAAVLTAEISYKEL